MKELQIIVAGNVGTGKSTLTFILEQFLLEKGFNVELRMENELLDDYKTEERFHRVMSENFSERELNLIKNAKITLKQIQTHRDSTKKNEF